MFPKEHGIGSEIEKDSQFLAQFDDKLLFFLFDSNFQEHLHGEAAPEVLLPMSIQDFVAGVSYELMFANHDFVVEVLLHDVHLFR